MNNKTEKLETYYPKSKQAWRKWLEKNHIVKDSIWVIFYRKSANKPTLTWSESVDEALCFGWIDSVKRKLDDERSIQLFAKRKPNSTWSKINKEKVERLIADDKMRQAGLERITIAKQNGTWDILNDVEDLIIPNDLQEILNTNTVAHDYFIGLKKTYKKMLLQWLLMAKRPDTRTKRIEEIFECAKLQQKPKHIP
jgi:uncharacterized protein YdeI (YjbR/CyaY-like superfamily)